MRQSISEIVSEIINAKFQKKKTEPFPLLFGTVL